jgi:HD-GYP domain-containing protein (c-di-GMP phosphodiesterase class II)
MGHISEFTSVSAELFKEGQILPVDIYIYLPLNKSIVFFQRKGDQLSASDIRKLASLPKNTLLVHRTDSRRLLEGLSSGITDKISSGNIDSAEVRSGAGALLKSIESSAPAGELVSEDDARQILSDVSVMVENIISHFDKSKAVRLYDEMLEKSKKTAQNPISRHCSEVAAIAVLTMLTVGDKRTIMPKPPDPDSLAHLGVAGLLHDLGLSQCPKTVVERHLIGEDENLTFSEKLIYMQHVDLTAEILKKAGSVLPQDVMTAIAYHHENLNGTGFRGVAGEKIPVMARILRIADDIVSCISNPARPVGFRQSLAILTERDRDLDVPIYDIDIMNELVTLQP